MRVLDLDMDYFMKSVATFINESEPERLPEEDYGDSVWSEREVRNFLESETLISDFEALAGYSFPEEFKSCIIQHNGGRIQADSEGKKHVTVPESFLSFNIGDSESMWKFWGHRRGEWPDGYVPFAVDGSGNLFCFDMQDDTIWLLKNSPPHSRDFSRELGGAKS